MKKIVIPKRFGYPTFDIVFNYKRYTLNTGVEIEVDDGLAEVIQNSIALQPKEDENVHENQCATVRTVLSQSYFRGKYSTNAEIEAIKGTQNDFAYSVESGTVWTYSEVKGWEDSGEAFPNGAGDADLTGYVKFTDHASSTKAGVSFVKGGDTGISIRSSDGTLQVEYASKNDISNKNRYRQPITPIHLDYAWKVSATTNTETLTEDEKTSACETIGALKQDNTTSSYYRRVYSVNKNGELNMFPVSDGDTAEASSLPHYFGNTTGYGDKEPTGKGVLITGLPQRKFHTVPKVYVDNLPDYLTLTSEQKAKWANMVGGSVRVIYYNGELTNYTVFWEDLDVTKFYPSQPSNGDVIISENGVLYKCCSDRSLQVIAITAPHVPNWYQHTLAIAFKLYDINDSDGDPKKTLTFYGRVNLPTEDHGSDLQHIINFGGTTCFNGFSTEEAVEDGTHYHYTILCYEGNSDSLYVMRIEDGKMFVTDLYEGEITNYSYVQLTAQ